jgi:hypothetical protein
MIKTSSVFSIASAGRRVCRLSPCTAFRSAMGILRLDCWCLPAEARRTCSWARHPEVQGRPPKERVFAAAYSATMANRGPVSLFCDKQRRLRRASRGAWNRGPAPARLQGFSVRRAVSETAARPRSGVASSLRVPGRIPRGSGIRHTGRGRARLEIKRAGGAARVPDR